MFQLRIDIWLIAFVSAIGTVSCYASVTPPLVGTTTTTSAPVSDDTAADARFGDEEIASIVAIAHARELEEAQLAQSRATNAAVRAYAERIARDEAALQTQWADQTIAMSFLPRASDESLRLTTETDLELQTMRTRYGAEFDRAFIESQVRMNSELLDLIDRRLLPIVRASSLRTTLEDTRPTVLMHLQLADQIADDLIAR